jgi:hypothetical protein
VFPLPAATRGIVSMAYTGPGRAVDAVLTNTPLRPGRPSPLSPASRMEVSMKTSIAAGVRRMNELLDGHVSNVGRVGFARMCRAYGVDATQPDAAERAFEEFEADFNRQTNLVWPG